VPPVTGSTSVAGVTGFVKVDTDSDGAPDTFLPGTSNWAAGRSAFPQKYYDRASGCHIEDEGQHCPLVSDQPILY